MATITETQRVFKYNGTELADPQPGMPIEDVRAFHANAYPELATAAITGPTNEGGKLVYEFKKAIGTKG